MAQTSRSSPAIGGAVPTQCDERQIRHAQKMESIGQLAGGIAHDFNNLLTAIMGYTQLGASIAAPESPLWGHFQEILKASERAAELTSQLLAFSRRQDTERQETNLNHLILSTHKMLRRLIGENIELVTVAAPDLDLITADPGQIEQVLINLAVNARDAMPDGGKLIIETHNGCHEASSASVQPGPVVVQHVRLSVSDNGTGMPDDVKERIFEPFFTTKAPGQGTGLGLSICHGIVRRHGGYISVETRPGDGSTFTVCLPRSDGGATTRQRRELYGRPIEGKELVLVVDDEETVREMVARVLRQQGYTVLEAENGDEALRVAQDFADKDIGLDLLVTDIVMPIMGGRELAYRLRARQSGAKVLYTSGYTDDIMIRQGQLQPGVEFIAKPFTPDSLAIRVRETLDS